MPVVAGLAEILIRDVGEDVEGDEGQEVDRNAGSVDGALVPPGEVVRAGLERDNRSIDHKKLVADHSEPVIDNGRGGSREHSGG